MRQLEIQDHSEILKYLDGPIGKYECGQLKYLWSKYESPGKYDTWCFCSRAEREEFLSSFKTWFAQMEINLGND